MAQIRQVRRPSCTKIQLLFVFILMFWAFIPARLVPWVGTESLKINFNEILLVLGAGCALILSRFGSTNRQEQALRFPFSLTLLLIYAAVSFTWSEVSGVDAEAMAWTLTTATAAAMFAFFYIRTSDVAVCKERLWILTLVLTIASALYFAESFFDLGLRSAEDTAWTDFGIQRLRGPLYNSTMGQFILFPCLGCAADRLFNYRTPRWITFSAILVLTGCLLALGSRSVIIGFALFGFVAVMKLKALGRIAFLGIASTIFLLAAGLVLSRADTGRLANSEDLSRAITYSTSINMITSGTPLTQIFGYGYGARWPWYIADITPGLMTGLNIVETRFGVSLYHPHSTILLVLVELGIVGLFLGACVLVWFLRCIRVNLKRRNAIFLNIGLIASLPICVFDLAIFKSPLVNTIWWIYVFGTVTMSQLPAKAEPLSLRMRDKLLSRHLAGRKSKLLLNVGSSSSLPIVHFGKS